jgi:hypothetical protein
MICNPPRAFSVDHQHFFRRRHPYDALQTIDLAPLAILALFLVAPAAAGYVSTKHHAPIFQILCSRLNTTAPYRLSIARTRTGMMMLAALFQA